MDPSLSFDPAIGNAITVDSPITLRLRAGSAVFAVRGEAWITQEGTPHDVILAAGGRFDVPTRAPLVVSATRGRVDLCVVRPSAARLSASSSVHDVLRAHAVALRRAAGTRLLDALALGARALLSPRTRMHTH